MAAPSIGIGELRVLSVGRGDLKITFRPDASAKEKSDARKTVERMLKDGYALLVEREDGSYTPCKGFDEETCSYIVSALPKAKPGPKPGARKKSPKRATVRVPAASTRTVAVARSAGG